MEIFQKPDATHNNRSDNFELSRVAAIVEDTLRDQARIGREGAEAMEMTGIPFRGMGSCILISLREANEALRHADRIGYMILEKGKEA
jgi:hypothetical protein